MKKLEILKPGLMTSIQDLGRIGLAYYAIPRSGAMDRNAAKIANLLLGRDEEAAVIECTSIAPEILFYNATRIAISGADFQWTLNGERLAPNLVLSIKEGDTLKGRNARSGLRGYIAIEGRFEIDKVYDSFSTYSKAGLGGFQGRIFKKGDILRWQEEEILPDIFTMYEGPEYNWLSDEAKDRLHTSRYRISAETDRMGLRLQGDPLHATSYQLANSAPVLPGFIQLPPSGLPIIVLQDGQTTGGYPRIGYIKEKDLIRLNQLQIGKNIAFQKPLI